jgi:hypothetical protein
MKKPLKKDKISLKQKKSLKCQKIKKIKQKNLTALFYAFIIGAV